MDDQKKYTEWGQVKVLDPDTVAALPTFDGNDPKDDGAWSWDKDRLLGNTWLGGFEIVDR